MNIDIIKEKIKSLIGKEVKIEQKCMRNRKEVYEGKVYKLYPNIFSIMTDRGEKTFPYADFATKDITIKLKKIY